MRYEPTIDLTWPLLWVSKHLASLHNGKESHFGAMTYGSVRGGEEAHLIGLYAEVAISHYFNVPIDVSTYERGDTGTDLFINGKKISVKSTTYWNAPLLRVEKEHFENGHIYFCAAVSTAFKKVRLVGWATSKIVRKGEVRVFVRGGPENYVLRPDQMREFENKTPLPS